MAWMLAKRGCWIMALWLANCPLSGCNSGSDGPPRYRLTGLVTYEGKPVPRGMIRFSPDSEAGNRGPGSGSGIKDGRYEAPQEHGVVGGPMIVQIWGTDGIPTTIAGEHFPDGKPLFPEYKVKVELPKESAEHNFEVPPGGKPGK